MKKGLQIYDSIVIENFKCVPLCPIKWLPLKVFTKLHNSPILIANIVKATISGLRQFLATKNLWEIMKNTFYFIWTTWICYCKIQFCSYYAFSLNQISDIRDVWEYHPLKDSSCSISKKFYRATILWWVDQTTSNF